MRPHYTLIRSIILSVGYNERVVRNCRYATHHRPHKKTFIMSKLQHGSTIDRAVTYLFYSVINKLGVSYGTWLLGLWLTWSLFLDA